MRALLWAVAVLALAACSPHRLLQADPRVGVRLPRDDFAHDDAQTEWWHFHGHLSDPAGRRYDWFLGFVRQHTDLDTVLGIPIRWFVDPLEIAYFSVLDRATGRFVYREKHAFPDTWAARARTDRFDLRHDSWRAEGAGGTFAIRARAGSTEARLRLRALKPPTLMGERGYVNVPPRSAHYFDSMPRMAVRGTLWIDGEARPVEGLGWYKHQWGFLYSEHVAGWVWLGTQLSNGLELEIGLIFDQQWNLAEGSWAVVIEAGGRAAPLRLGEIEVQERGVPWRSGRTGTVYPVVWIVRIPERDIELTLRAVIPNQEMVVFPANLWAGTLTVEGTFAGAEVQGDCFGEVVGLDEPFGRELVSTGRPDP